ncbi:MAG: hypothetical protein L3J37_04385 [Rhodobacteraceae bacterium]|nr:hypothetical protein [Paracoccaceae bacterium]
MLEAARATLWLLGLRGGQSLFNFIILALLAHRFSNADLAEILLLLSIITLGARLAVFGLDVTLLKTLGNTKSPARPLSSALAVFLLLWLPLGAGLYFLAWPLLPPEALLWLFLAALQVFQNSALVALQRQGAGFFIGGAFSALLTLIGVLILPELSVSGFVRLNIIALALNAVLAHGFIRHHCGTLRSSAALLPLLALAAPALLTNVLLYTAAQMPLWFLVWYADDAAVVNYGLALRLTIALGLIIEVSRALITPRFARNFHAGTLKQAEASLRRITSLATAAISTLALLALILIQPLFPLVFDRAGTPVFWVAFWLFASQITLAAIGPAHMALRIGGWQPAALGLSAAALLMLIPAMAVLFPVFGASGVAFAAFMTTLLFSLANLTLAKRVFHISTALILRAAP